MACTGKVLASAECQDMQTSELVDYIAYLEAKVEFFKKHHKHCNISAVFEASTSEGPYSWIDKRRGIGLETTDQNAHALTLLLGLRTDKLVDEDCYYGVSETTEENNACTYNLVNSARQYAMETKDIDTSTVFGMQIRIFRELIFSSLCALLEYKQLPVDTINDLMRICISSSRPANLYRLRRGALWANQVIACMFTKGWNRQATEFFLLSGCPVSQYGLLCEARVHSTPYFRDRFVEVQDIVQTPNDDIRWIPFSIPLIIKGIVGDVLNLEEICIALNYDVNML